MDMFLGDYLLWLVLVGLPANIVLLLITIFILHESPKYLFPVKSDTLAAERAIRYYHGQIADVSEVCFVFLYKLNEK
jgi:hypothetical protein